MKSSEIRKKFLDYFKSQQHEVVPSSSLIPGNDPTLLFTNAGMVQFKDVFLGNEQRPYKRATSSQCCMRAGGKHNDLENVGYTARHHTFFEMLGNFSFGDYFKKEAIHYTWDFLTQVLKLPPEKLWVTVFKDDQESENIWLNDIKVDAKRFSRCGEKDNFWSMGDVGPCGPCTEIFYDHGPSIAGGPPGSPDEDGDRYIEIWNLVFMQYNRQADGSLVPLAQQSVDTGMGLERLAAVLQNVHNNYDTDLFVPIIGATAKLAGIDDHSNQSLRVIADHIRSTAFLIIDGVRPSNEGRGYILRRIIRRAVRHGHKLGLTDTFFYRLVQPLADVMAAAYPLLSQEKNVIEQIIQQEEQQFARTLTQGMVMLEQGLAKLSDKIIPGELAFTLYDTYGFPVDLTADIAREHGLSIDYETLEQRMTQQRQQSREAGQFKMQAGNTLSIQGDSQFLGYQYLQHDGMITDLFINEQAVKKLETGNKGIIVLEQTPFYAESGGQVGDIGKIESEHGVFMVEDTQKQGTAILHIGHVRSGYFAVNDKVKAQVDHANRQAIVLNHSATHLLHAALRQQLGKHVVQKGSLVAADYLRFDFSHPKPLTDKELTAIEKLVNDNIRLNHLAITEEMSPAQAQQSGAMALFGEKYGDKVRVLSMGDFSKELCGGTHVKNTGDIGLLKITNETGIASGIRRIEAVTGAKALDWLNEKKEDLLKEITTLKEKSKQQTKQLKQLQQQLHQQQSSNLTDQTKEIHGIKVLAVRIKTASSDVLRTTLDQLKNKLGRAIIVLASENGEKINLIAGVSKDLIPPFHAGKLVNMVAAQVGGKGGGRPDMAQAGGNQPQHLDKALDSVYTWVAEQVDQKS